VQNIVQLALGAVLLAAVAAVVIKALIDRRRQSAIPPPAAETPMHVRRLATLAIGAAVGTVVGITSTGSGTLIIVMLLLIYPQLRGSQTVGTDLTQAIPMVGAAAVAHILFGDFKLGLTLSIVAGSIPGVLLGSLVSSRSSTRPLRAALCVVRVVLLAAIVLVPAGLLLLRNQQTRRREPAARTLLT
jgi:uncharacterized membrane protein YfcA